MGFFKGFLNPRIGVSTDGKLTIDGVVQTGGGNGGLGVLVYNTLSDLQAAYPNGANQPAWVIADNEWYYWTGSTVTLPTDVTGLTSSSITQTTLNLSWTASSGATSYDVYNGATLLTNVTGTSYNVTGLTLGTSYTLKVVAKNAGGSASGATVNVTTTASPPADVTNLATSNVSNSSATLSWTSSTGATSYDVYNGATLLGNTTSASYQATGLSASTAYTFKVIAKNAAGSSTGVTINVTTLATAPNPVTALATGTIAPSTVAVSWTAPSGGSAVDHYEVAYEANGASSYTVSSNLVNSSSTSYTVTGLHQSTSYTIRVVAIDASGNRSQATTVSATTIALTASASPAAGTFTSSQTVTLSSNGVTGTNIYYTTDGSTPTTSSTLYSSAITVSATETIKFFAQNPVGDQSAVQSVTYTINLSDTTPPVVTASPNGGTYNYNLNITLTANKPSTIYYTTNGTTPTQGSTQYTGPIAISATTTLKFIGVDTSGNVSTSQTALFTIDKTAPVITASPGDGSTFTTSTQNVTLTSNKTGTTIYYTLDGTDPTTNSPVYSAPITLSASTTIKYFGVDTAGNSSAEQAATYTKIVVIASDSFNRADSTTPGSTEIGNFAWTDSNSSNVWGISSNTMKNSSGSGKLLINSGVSDNISIECVMVTASGTQGLMFRYAAANSYLVLTGSSFLTLTPSGWVSPTLTSGSYSGFNAGDKVRVDCKGSNITVFVNDVQKATYTSTLNQTATNLGLYGNGNCQFDNFKLTQNV